MLMSFAKSCWPVLMALAFVHTEGWAEQPRVLDTGPANNGIVSWGGEEFFVRFNQPVDHIQSRLIIKRGDSIIETLQPRLNTEPSVLFARSAGLPPGEYTLVWMVRTLQGEPIAVGDVMFKVEGRK